jgi:hypothetical protein
MPHYTDYISKINGIIVGTHYVRPTDFGCKGNGKDNDLKALQECIDYAVEHGFDIDCEGKVYFIQKADNHPDFLRITNGISISNG